MSKKKGTKKDSQDFEFWNEIAIAVQNVTIKIGEFEKKIDNLTTKVEKIQRKVQDIQTIRADINYLKEVAKQVDIQEEDTKKGNQETKQQSNKKKRYK